MKEELAELVRETCRVWSSGDLEGTLAFIHPDTRWQPSGRFIGSGETYRGREGVMRFWAIFREPWESVSLEPVDFIDVDDARVVTRTRFRGAGRTSGVVTETELFVLWTVEDGLIARYQSFGDREEALAAAGRADRAGASG